MSKKSIWSSVDKNSDMLSAMARKIWEKPELPLEEEYASMLQVEEMEKQGFKVTHGLKGLPTAMIAEFGNGKPIIGILGEYDALSGLSQDSVAERKPVVEGGAGHGCGHNLLGVGGIGAAIAVKEAIEKGELKGTIRYYGCPAEEELIGKIFMLRDGYFDDCDAVLYWHPSSNNAPWRAPSLAASSVVFSFKGLTAHAPQAHLGRSALDAVELMNVGANYLREHIPKEVFMHYSVVGNGIAPNTVPDNCQVWYMMRAPKREVLDSVYPRLIDVAKGAALMTGTTLENIEFMGGGNETVVSQTIADIMVSNMEEIGGPGFTEEDYSYAKEISELFTPEERIRGAQAFQIPPCDYDNILQHNIVSNTKNDFMPASGDFDVSWLIPFGGVNCATWPIGVFTHTWQATASAGSSVGFHGMLFAAKTIAGTAYDLMNDKNLMESVKNEFAESTKDKKYKFNISHDSIPKRVKL